MKKVMAALCAVSVLIAFASCEGDPAGASSSSGTSSSGGTSSGSGMVSIFIPPVEDEPENIALGDNVTYIDMNTGKTAEDEDYLAYYPGDTGDHTPDLSFNGSISDGWQLKSDEVRDENYTDGDDIPDGWYVATGDGGLYKQLTYNDGDVWVGLVFDEAVTVETILLKWESGSVPYSFGEGGYRIEYTTDGETWQDLEGAEVTRDDGTVYASTYCDTVTVEPTEITGLRVVVVKCTTKYSPKLWEFEVYAAEEEETSSEAVSDDVSEETSETA